MSLYEISRSLYIPGKNAGPFEKFARPALMNLTGAMVELPYAMFFLNLKNNMIAHNTPVTETIKGVYASKGWKGFYKGTLAEILRQSTRQLVRGPSTVYMNPMLKSYFPDAHPMSVSFASGLMIGILDATVTAPLESFKTWLTTREGSIEQKKPFKPFSGYPATLVRQAAAWPICFVSSVYFQDLMKEFQKKEQLTYGDLAVISPCVSASFILPPHPFDVVKIRQQAANISQEKALPPSLGKAIMDIAKTEGIAAFSRGALISVLQRSPTAFIIMVMQKFYNDEKNNPNPVVPLSQLVGVKASSSPNQPEKG